jgi:phage anti-repressor protein
MKNSLKNNKNGSAAIANLFMYMNYHSTTDYPINLETAVKILGFAHKKNAKRTLENNFIEGEDYKITVLPTEHGQFASEEIMLNMDTFKNLCMLVKTPEGKAIRKYYVKLENINNKIVKMEIEEKEALLILEKENSEKLLKEKEQQLQEKDNIIQTLENKPDTTISKYCFSTSCLHIIIINNM